MAIVTISRQLGSLGDEVATALSSKLGWSVITRQTLLDRYLKPVSNSRDFHILKESAKAYLDEYKPGFTYLAYLEEKLYELTEDESVVMVGFGSQVIFADHDDALHVRIIAPENIRINRVRRQYSVEDEEARRILVTADRKHKRFVSTIFDIDLTHSDLYDLTLNTAKLSVDACVAAIISIQDDIQQQKDLVKTAEGSNVIVHNGQMHDFKHPAEIEFARILDMYQIEWKYEPKTFPIEWDAEGNVTLAFSPDFYLPKFDTYLELTTMNQKYVTMKNRKARKVRELYPGTNVKIVYKKDFQSLVERFSGMKG